MNLLLTWIVSAALCRARGSSYLELEACDLLLHPWGAAARPPPPTCKRHVDGGPHPPVPLPEVGFTKLAAAGRIDTRGTMGHLSLHLLGRNPPW